MITEQDRTFAKMAAQSNLAEVALAEIAEDKEDLPASVQGFAEAMKNDHGKAQQQLETLATDLDIELPEEPSEEHQAKAAQLEELSGDAFAAEYMRTMVDEHTKAVQLFEQQVQKSQGAAAGQRSQLDQFAAAQLPILEQHLTQAKDIEAELTPTASR